MNKFRKAVCTHKFWYSPSS